MMTYGRKPWENASGKYDPTAYEAIRAVAKDEKEMAQERCANLVSDIRRLVHERGFDLIGRVMLRDRVTGRRFK